MAECGTRIGIRHNGLLALKAHLVGSGFLTGSWGTWYACDEDEKHVDRKKV
ncbi:unnamed protein product [Sphenostylis stenocarpa]|uniref:Uncharacterized protein n=1 Tax=Sphenostylis stenocarpa TaxID=92480 RepID=A0AA86W0Y0_9FABA|nr:unnamed protein product [Sphenostylis stenocarpa]